MGEPDKRESLAKLLPKISSKDIKYEEEKTTVDVPYRRASLTSLLPEVPSEHIKYRKGNIKKEELDEKKVVTTSLPTHYPNGIRYLCMEAKESSKWIECENGSELENTCFDTVLKKLMPCQATGVIQLSRLCVKATTRNVVLCDQNDASICHSKEYKPAIELEICSEEDRKLCFSDLQGYLVSCRDLGITNDTRQFTGGNFREFDSHLEERSGKQEEGENNQNLKRMCMSEAEELVKCEEVPSDSEACIDGVFGEVDICTELEFPIPLCSEGNSSKINVCSDWLSENGGISMDETFEAHSSQTYETWKNWWDEFFIDPNPVKKQANHSQPHLCMPTSEGKGFAECTDDSSDRKACISVRNGAINDCESGELYLESNFAVPICVDSSSKNIITCGGFRYQAYLCFPEDNESFESPVKPCADRSREICLSDEGYFEKCHKSTTSQPESKPAHDDKTDRTPEVPVWKDNTQHLCILEDNRLQRCPASSLTVACLNTHMRQLESCRETELNFEIGIPVCAEDITNKLLTCGEISQANLCHRPESHLQLKYCNDESRMLCVAKNGGLKKCSDMLVDGAELNTKTNPMKHNETEQSVTPPEETVSVNLQHKQHEELCVSRRTGQVVECQDFMKTEFACLGLGLGKIVPCSKKLQQLLIRICRNVNTSELSNCDAFNKVNLCPQPFSKGKYLTSCGRGGKAACFFQGKIQSCSSLKWKSTKPRSLPRAKRSMEVKYRRHKYQSSGYRNSDDVYRVENSSIVYVMRDLEPLCHDIDEKITACASRSAPDLNFVCFGAIGGKLKKCKDKTELVIPMCVQSKTKKVFTCGKFSRGHLCKKSEHSLETCNQKTRQICLTKRGKLMRCQSMGKNATKDDQTHQNFRTDIRGTDDGPSEDDEYSDYYYDEDEDETKKNDMEVQKDYTVFEVEEEIKKVYEYEPEYDDYESGKDEPERDEEESSQKLKSEVMKKIFGVIANGHKTSRHLCKLEPKRNKLINCDEDRNMKFACIGAKSGRINICNAYEEDDVGIAICAKVNTNYLVTCDVWSSVNLCFGNKYRIVPCKNKTNYFVCVGKNGTLKKCKKSERPAPERPSTTEKPEPETPKPESTDEKFYHMNCRNCTIENKMVIVGSPADVLPELEVITFPNDR